MTTKKKWQPNIIAGAATVHDGLFLLLKRSKRETFLPNVWGIPAGHVVPEEDPGDACKRELLEETGLFGTIIDLISYNSFVSHRSNVTLSNLQLNFLVRVDDCDVRLDETSHSAFRWISLDDVENEFVDPFTKNIMISARRRYKNACMRESSTWSNLR